MMDMDIGFGIWWGIARFLQLFTRSVIFSRARHSFVILEIKFSTHQSRLATPAISLVLSRNSIFARTFSSPPFVFDSHSSTLWFRGGKNFAQHFREFLLFVLVPLAALKLLIVISLSFLYCDLLVTMSK